MSSLKKQYYANKIQNNDYLYLFKVGNFYVFFNEDAKTINTLYSLKIIPFGNDLFKCGFPVNSLNKYNELFKKDHLKIILVTDKNEEIDYDKIVLLVNGLRKKDLNINNLKTEIRKLKEIK